MAPATPERVSVGIGLCVVMLAALPRFIVNDLETRQTLIGLAIVIVAVVMAINIKMLSTAARQRLPSLLKSLLLAMAAGLAVMALWHSLTSDWFSWQELISNGTTLGLLLHALNLWRKPLSSE
ncbi:hypothetical protein LG277_07250 [Vreelandella aquamarina]|uniref:hypothetical protein n=1 Tax=Vreelandella aquamarina TaxID=77097 RepID=UPI00384C1CF8